MQDKIKIFWRHINSTRVHQAFYYALVGSIIFFLINIAASHDAVLGVAIGLAMLSVCAGIWLDALRQLKFRAFIQRMRVEKGITDLPDEKKDEEFQPFRRYLKRRRHKKLRGFSDREKSYIITRERAIVGSLLIKVMLAVFLAVLAVYLYIL